MIVEKRIEEGMKFIIRGHYFDESKKIMLASHDETKLDKADSYIQAISTYYQDVELRYGFDRYSHFEKTGKHLPPMDSFDFFHHMHNFFISTSMKRPF